MRVEIRDGLESRPDVGPLAAAVYPPEVLANIVWRSVVSARATRRVLVYDDDGSLVAAAGVLFRTGTLNSSKSNIAGIGGVMTLPTRQREGFGSVAMNAAHQLVARESTSAFGLLFCEPKNFSFYHSLGWSSSPAQSSPSSPPRPRHTPSCRHWFTLSSRPLQRKAPLS